MFPVDLPLIFLVSWERAGRDRGDCRALLIRWPRGAWSGAAAVRPVRGGTQPRELVPLLSYLVQRGRAGGVGADRCAASAGRAGGRPDRHGGGVGASPTAGAGHGVARLVVARGRGDRCRGAVAAGCADASAGAARAARGLGRARAAPCSTGRSGGSRAASVWPCPRLDLPGSAGAKGWAAAILCCSPGIGAGSACAIAVRAARRRPGRARGGARLGGAGAGCRDDAAVGVADGGRRLAALDPVRGGKSIQLPSIFICYRISKGGVFPRGAARPSSRPCVRAAFRLATPRITCDTSRRWRRALGGAAAAPCRDGRHSASTLCRNSHMPRIAGTGWPGGDSKQVRWR